MIILSRNKTFKMLRFREENKTIKRPKRTTIWEENIDIYMNH